MDSTPEAAQQQDRQRLEATARTGAALFYWIVVLGVINGVVVLCGLEYYVIASHLEFGLGLTRLFTYLAWGAGPGEPIRIVGFVATLGGCGVFAVLGAQAHQRRQWAFTVGTVFYALDSLVFVTTRNWVAVGFHLVVLLFLLRGARAAEKLSAAGGVPAPADIALTPEQVARRRLVGVVATGANCFYWVVALASLNGVVMLCAGEVFAPWYAVITSGDLSMGVMRLFAGMDSGLGLTHLFAHIAGGADPGETVRLIGFAATLTVCGLLTAFGALARKRIRWAFIAGIVLYALDGLLFLPFGGWLGAGFHLVVLLLLIRAARALGALAEEGDGVAVQER